MIIDFHTHIFPEPLAYRTVSMLAENGNITPFCDGTKEGLRRSMKEAGIGCSVVLPIATRPEQFHSLNRFADELNQTAKESGIISFGGIHPCSGQIKEELKELKAMGMKGIKLHPDYQGIDINDIRVKRMAVLAGELDLIITVHSGFDVGFPTSERVTPKKVRELIDDVKPEKLVLAHYGSMYRWEEAEELLVGQDVYFDTAVVFGKIREEQFLRILKAHGTEKILFATDSPWNSQADDVEYMRQLIWNETEYNLIMGKNAEKLLNM